MSKKLYPAALCASILVVFAVLLGITNSFAVDIAGESAAEDNKAEISASLREYIACYEASVAADNRIELISELINDENNIIKHGGESDKLDIYTALLKEAEGEREKSELGMKKYEILLSDAYPDGINIDDAEAELMTLIPEDIDGEAAAEAAVSKALSQAADAAESSARVEFDSIQLQKKLDALSQVVDENNKTEQTTTAQSTETTAQTVAVPTTEPETQPDETTVGTEGHEEADTACTCHYCLSLTTEETTTQPGLRPRNVKETSKPDVTEEPQTTDETDVDTAQEQVVTDIDTTPEQAETDADTAQEQMEQAETVSAPEPSAPEPATETSETTAEQFSFDASEITIDEKPVRDKVNVAVIDIQLLYLGLKKSAEDYASQSELCASLQDSYKKNRCEKADVYLALCEKYKMRAELFKALCEYDAALRSLDALCGGDISA